MQITEQVTLSDGRPSIITDDGQAWIKQGDEKPIEVVTVWSIVPVAMLDAPMRTKGFEKVAEDGTVEYLSIRQYCDVTTASYQVSNDGRYFIFGYMMSDLDNDLKTAKATAKGAGFTLAGKDYTQTADNLVWLGLNHREVQDFMKVNPMFKPAEEVV
jgi:hypothetical protein